MDEIAIFWDYENANVTAQGINVPIAEAILYYVNLIGHPRIKKVYSNWRTTSDIIIQALYSYGFEPIQISMGKRNSIDVKLAVDCIDIAVTLPSIKYFIIVSGDKDYISLINWLKANQKRVILMGNADIVSEHLMLSADEFVSFEELSKLPLDQKPPEYGELSEAKQETPENKMTFDEAIECLIEAVKKARDQGKSTRYELIDNYMRTLPKSNYRGAKSIVKSDENGRFSSFSKFVEVAEDAKKIKTEIVEGFKEIYLLEEDPKMESEFSPIIKEKIDLEHWKIIIEQIKKCFTEGKPGPLYGRFSILMSYLRSAKKEGALPFSNKTLSNVLNQLVDIGFLKKQDDGSLRIMENYETNLDRILQNMIKSSAS